MFAFKMNYWRMMRSQLIRRNFRFGKRDKNFNQSNIIKLGAVSPERIVPEEIGKPDYYYECNTPGSTLGEPEIKNDQQIKGMRASGRLAAKVLAACEDIIKVGTTTDEIDAFVHDMVITAKAYPSPLRYAGFPKSICTSVNNVACHGIPDDRRLLDGDILNVDVTVFFGGYHGDCSKTFLLGNVDERDRYLVDSTHECLEQCIKLCKPGVPFSSIGRFISQFCREKRLGLIPAFTGHGIGSFFHGPPEILHFENRNPGNMQSGMTFTIEPVLTLGGPNIVILEDGWTAVSADGERSAQFEHTVLITEDGSEILTNPM